MVTVDAHPDSVGTIRAFNRFWTNRMGLLAEGLLDSTFSLTEARVLFELATRNHPTATGIGRELGLDPGYLSRILKSFDRRGLIDRAATPGDGRQRSLTLTETGRAAFAPLDAASRRQAGSLIESLGDGVADMVKAMRTIQQIFCPSRAKQRPSFCVPRNSVILAGLSGARRCCTNRNMAGTSRSKSFWLRFSPP
jgi:DNA-binding MarR family transcriptional regulator